MDTAHTCMPTMAYISWLRTLLGLAGVFSSSMIAQPGLVPWTSKNGDRAVCGAELYIITPVSRFQLKEELMKIARSMHWECVTQWILVYDTSRQHDLEPQFAGDTKVVELYFHAENGAILGNMQRNKALTKVTQGLVYFLDDDNIMHPHFWDILPNIYEGKMTTFDQMRMEDDPPQILNGSEVAVNHIDTGMMVIDRALIGDTQWHPSAGNADGYFAAAVVAKHADKHKYIPEVAAYHHGLSMPLNP